MNMGCSLNRRKHQRKINASVKKVNKNIYDDYAWKGRFHIRQICSEFVIFYDKSGAYLICYFELVDKLTNKGKVICIEESDFFDSELWSEVNSFIIEDCGARCVCFDERDTVPDFRDVPAVEHSMRWWRDTYPYTWWNMLQEV